MQQLQEPIKQIIVRVNSHPNTVCRCFDERVEKWKSQGVKPVFYLLALQVFAAAAAGFEAHGVELNPWLVTYSRLKAASLGLNKRTKFYRRDLWKFSIHGYKNIVVFGVEEMMPELEAKIKAEVSKDTHIIACRFPFPSWTPSVIVGSGIDKVWLYESEKI
ncbi:ATP synthase subunit C lysine N-methyltransferase isoform X2 [Schistocerca cancellata]|uniref:ATP synthase subunit C lysine N-methyltransferase isoform X2 n=1 Tax=Schistocerca cancellata TaxID=274614 RepID=UPI0021196D20|nr:ATP synthase subunit C lysine N-methyltransferase isoform X2 [Schistocerca cancellata]